jgi:hypothetical protein
MRYQETVLKKISQMKSMLSAMDSSIKRGDQKDYEQTRELLMDTIRNIENIVNEQ